jgi:hypothetical protein
MWRHGFEVEDGNAATVSNYPVDPERKLETESAVLKNVAHWLLQEQRVTPRPRPLGVVAKRGTEALHRTFDIDMRQPLPGGLGGHRGQQARRACRGAAVDGSLPARQGAVDGDPELAVEGR